jgi:hypothetical protein
MEGSAMKYRFTLSIGLSGAEHKDEFDLFDDLGEDPEEWQALGSDEQQKRVDQHWSDWAWNYIDGGATPVEDDE